MTQLIRYDMKQQQKNRNCSGITMVEAVISTVILSFIAQILVYGYQFTNTQANSAMSKNTHVVEDVNNCMEYILRALDQNTDRSGDITNSEMAFCQTRCQEISSNSNIQITKSSNDVQLFPDKRIKGYWITVTASSSASSDPDRTYSYSASTLATYYDDTAATTSVTANQKQKTLDLDGSRRTTCQELDNYEKREYIPLPSLLYAKLRLACAPQDAFSNDTELQNTSSAAELKAKIQLLTNRVKGMITDITGITRLFLGSTLSRAHCFSDGVCVSTASELHKLYTDATKLSNK